MVRKHNEDFKREVVRLALKSGLTRRQVASDLGVGFSTLAKWVQHSRSDDLSPSADIDLAKENKRLRKENRPLLQERETLKNATVFFAQQSTFPLIGYFIFLVSHRVVIGHSASAQ